jgi:hypothetical protein
MSCNGRRWVPIAAVTVIAAGSQLIPATARADLHNVTYRARIDALTTGSQATFVINGGQTNTAGLPSVPGNVFEANTVLPDPGQAACGSCCIGPIRRTCTARSTSTTTFSPRPIKWSDLRPVIAIR